MAHILLIDDDEPVRTVLRLMLTHHGHTVIEARNGREGLQLFQAGHADLVITDLVMPEIEGFEVLMELRKLLPGVKVIVISGGVRGRAAGYLEMALHLGANKVLPKPFPHEDLRVAVNDLLSADAQPAPPR